MPADLDEALEQGPEGADLEEALAGEPLFSFDGELRILAWYRAAEELKGVGAAEALGRCCWEVLEGVGDDGALVCRRDCSLVRLARRHWAAPCLELRVRTRADLRPVSLSTIAIRGGPKPVFLHLLRRRPAVSSTRRLRGSADQRAPLTPRQLEVLELLAEGVRAKEAAGRLGLSETTVRNHIRAVLTRLDCHSQLQAVAKARRLGLIGRESGGRPPG